MTSAPVDIDAVADLMREAAASAITPRFRALESGSIEEKAPGELVTAADREAELILTRGLLAMTPPAVVVGEAAAADEPALLAAVSAASSVWLVDPLDGTRNFIDGSPDHAVMVARVVAGETVAAWILHPVSGAMYVAERGAGAWLDGRRIVRPPAPAGPGALRGAVLTRFLSAAGRAYIEERAGLFGQVGEGSGCAGVTYPQVAEGAADFAAFHRTLAWDHAPGALLLSEAGGHVARLDGGPYAPGQTSTGLLAAADASTWATVRDRLLPPS